MWKLETNPDAAQYEGREMSRSVLLRTTDRCSNG